MASPQKENGYTPIANEILEAIQQHKFNLNEMKIIMCVWRFTYGFNRKQHSMSLTFFENHTGLGRKRLNESLKKLVESDVLKKEEQGHAKASNTYSFNKDYEDWKIEKYSHFNDDTSVQIDTTTSSQDDTTTSVQDDTTTSGQNDTQERNIKTSIKTNIKQEEEKNPITFYEQNFGIMTPMQMQKVWSWVNDFGNKEVVYMAAEETALKNPASPFSYFERILSDWFRRKLFTIEDVLREKQKREREAKVTLIKPNYPREENQDGSNPGENTKEFGNVRLFR
ncbi:replication protein [Metabacillus fastidiosus]|uniref:replication protein n=1 Tax=Metabacillus fastidiosus TaxID=1458 RepID=UPI003D2D4331